MSKSSFFIFRASLLIRPSSLKVFPLQPLYLTFAPSNGQNFHFGSSSRLHTGQTLGRFRRNRAATTATEKNTESNIHVRFFIEISFSNHRRDRRGYRERQKPPWISLRVLWFSFCFERCRSRHFKGGCGCPKVSNDSAKVNRKVFRRYKSRWWPVHSSFSASERSRRWSGTTHISNSRSKRSDGSVPLTAETAKDSEKTKKPSVRAIFGKALRSLCALRCD